MSTDRARAHLYERLEATLGSDAADALMGSLPPVGWGDVATNAEISHLDARLTSRIDRLETHVDLRFESFEHRIAASVERGLRQGMIAVIGAVAALLSIAAVAAQLFR